MRANFGQADTLGSRRWGRPAVWLLTCALLWSPLVLADKDGDIDIRSAFTEVVDDVYYLNGRVELALSADALKALENGVALNIEFQIEVSQRRRYIWDSTVASLRQRYELAFHALTGRFVLANRNSGERESFSTLSGALARVGVIDDLPIIDRAPNHPNLVVATGHGMQGISMATSTGKMVMEIITGRRPHIDPTAFGIQRFL